MPQEHIKLGLYALGATDDTLFDYLEIANNQWDDVVGRPRVGAEEQSGDRLSQQR